MTRPTRRAFVAAHAAGLCFAQQTQTGSPAWPTKEVRWPREIGGVRIVDSRFASLAAEALLDCSPPYLVNHALRTFFFGAMIGMRKNLSFDAEILFLACALHDLGLTSAHAGPLPFEIQGAQAARKILETAGLPVEKARVVWDGIAMHPHDMSGFKPPEISLVGAGAGADVVGGGIKSLNPADVEATLRAFPRLEFKRRFVENCSEIAKKYPGAAKRTFMRDIAERTNPAYHVSNICDAITAAPFTE